MIRADLCKRLRDAFEDDGDTAIAMIDWYARVHSFDADALALALLNQGKESIDRFRASLPSPPSTPTDTKN